ncbi:MAG: RHS repeat protein, partial [Bryobacterales bacterium]|nr:RHS repeat protein [Bryobacterales bacterium]
MPFKSSPAATPSPQRASNAITLFGEEPLFFQAWERIYPSIHTISRNQLTAVTKLRNSTVQTRTFTYDQATGRLTSRTLPESGTTAFTYNTAGQLVSQTDARNQTVSYTYDDAGRVTQKGPYAFTYTGSRLATVTYGNLQEIYSYATGGQVATKTMRYSANGKSADLVATYTWSNGRLASVRPPNGHLFTFSYNSMGLPTGQQRVKPDDSIETLFSGGIFDHAGRLTGLTDAQGLPQTRTYDDVGRLTQSRINGGIFDQTYTYATAQDDGRLMSQTDAISGETVAYQYDTLGRLTRAETTGPQWGLAWTYDGFGNRLTQTVVKGSGPAASTPVYPATNRLQDASIDYDAAGNVTRFRMPDSSQRWLTWDALNRMTAAWTGSPYPDGHTEVYTYDAGNQR